MSTETLDAALQKLCKWRKFFASWQLGTRPAADGECRAVTDHREATLLQRAELNALTSLLVRKGVFTAEEFVESLEREAKLLDHQLEESYPGWRSAPDGMSMKMPEALETMQRLGFPR